MRKVALYLVLAGWICAGSAKAWGASERDSVGKSPEWESMNELLAATDELKQPAVAMAVATPDETPNQRRHRLGLPIEATFPAEEYGEKTETPNQMRARLGQAAPVAAAPEYGERQETPNQMKQRVVTAQSE